MKFGLFTQTKNIHFVSARQRIQPRVLELKKRLESIKLNGRFDNLLLTFVEQPIEHYDVIEKGPNDNIFEVDVGYDTAGDYPQQKDAAVVLLLEKKLQQVFASNEGFNERRQDLLDTVRAWTAESIVSMQHHSPHRAS